MRYLTLTASAAAIAIVSATGAFAQGVPEKMPFDIPYGTPVTYDTAAKLVNAAAAEAKKRNWKMNIAVVDNNGDLIAFARMDGAQIASVNISQGKARTAARFRRETPIGPYIADFAWLSARIIVEVDGDSHETESGKHHDQRRDRFLREQGFIVLRFDNTDVINSADAIFIQLEAELAPFLDKEPAL